VRRLLELEAVDVSRDVATLHDRLKRKKMFAMTSEVSDLEYLRYQLDGFVFFQLFFLKIPNKCID
jgi:hypothetical protein